MFVRKTCFFHSNIFFFAICRWLSLYNESKKCFLWIQGSHEGHTVPIKTFSMGLGLFGDGGEDKNCGRPASKEVSSEGSSNVSSSNSSGAGNMTTGYAGARRSGEAGSSGIVHAEEKKNILWIWNRKWMFLHFLFFYLRVIQIREMHAFGSSCRKE